MGRKRINFICPKCGQQGRYPRLKKTRNGEYLNAATNEYYYVEHYDPIKRKIRKTCYVDKIIIANDYDSDSIPFYYKTLQSIGKMISVLEGIRKNIHESNIDPEDDKILFTLMNDANDQLRRRVDAINRCIELSGKENKTSQQEKLLRKAKHILDHEIKITKQAGKIMDLYKNGKELDLDFPNIRKIINENMPGMYELSMRPENIALSYWFRKYEQPKRIEYRKRLNKKLSDAHFGSEKYPSQYSGLSSE